MREKVPIEGCFDVSDVWGVVMVRSGQSPPREIVRPQSGGLANGAGVIGGDPKAVRRDGSGAAESRTGVKATTSKTSACLLPTIYTYQALQTSLTCTLGSTRQKKFLSGI